MRALIAIALLAGCGDGGTFHTSGGSGMSPRIALANGHAYWFDGIGTLARALLTRPRSVARVALVFESDGNLHATSTHIYWRENAEIRRVDVGGTTDPVVVGETTAGVPANIAVDEDALYYPRDMAVIRQSLATRAETMLLTDRRAISLALDGDVLVGTSCTEGVDGVWRLSIEGGEAERISASGCGELAAVDDQFVYMFEIVDQRPAIVRLPKHGGSAVELLETASQVFAVQDGMLYAVSLDNQIVRVPAGGGEPTVLVDGPAEGLAVYDGNLYWLAKIGFSPDLALNVMPLPE